MKAILEFDLSEDREEYYKYMMASELASALWEIATNLKKECEYASENLYGNENNAYEGIDIVFRRIYNIIEENNINVNKL